MLFLTIAEVACLLKYSKQLGHRFRPRMWLRNIVCFEFIPPAGHEGIVMTTKQAYHRALHGCINWINSHVPHMKCLQWSQFHAADRVSCTN